MDNDNDKCFLSPKTHRFSYTIRRTKKIMCCSRNDDLTPGVNISIQMGRTVLTLCAQQDPNQAASVVALGPYDVTVTPRNPMNLTPERKRRSLKRYRYGVSGFHPQKTNRLSNKNSPY